MRRQVLIIALAAFFLAPAMAQAATVARDTDTILYTAAPLEADVVSVSLSPGFVTLQSSVGLSSSGCTQPLASTAKCPDSPIVEFNFLDGADRLTFSNPSDPLLAGHTIDADGGPGADTLVGGAAIDILKGGDDADDLTGGEGPDVLSGDGGNDVVRSRDGSADDVSCGAGADTAIVDITDVVAPDCETVDVPDSDGDGVGDGVDACPTQPGPASNNGCPASSQACDEATAKLKKAKAKLKKLKQSGASAPQIEKAKKKVKKAKEKKAKACD